MSLTDEPCYHRRMGRGEEDGKVALHEADGRGGGDVDATATRGTDPVSAKRVECECQGVKDEPVREGVLCVDPKGFGVDLYLCELLGLSVVGILDVCPRRMCRVRVKDHGEASGPADESRRGDQVESVVCWSRGVDAARSVAEGRVDEGDDGVLRGAM